MGREGVGKGALLPPLPSGEGWGERGMTNDVPLDSGNNKGGYGGPPLQETGRFNAATSPAAHQSSP